MVNSVDFTVDVGGGTVDTALALTPRRPRRSFGAFTPGVAQRVPGDRRAADHLDGRRRRR